MKQVIYIDPDKIEVVSWDRDDIDTLQYYTYKMSTEISWTNNIEEFIYTHPELLCQGVETKVIIDSPRIFFSPVSVDEKEFESLLSLAWPALQPSDEWCFNASGDIRSALQVEGPFLRFLARSFHPMEIETSIDILVKTWKKDSLNSAAPYKLFLFHYLEKLYFGLIDGKGTVVDLGYIGETDIHKEFILMNKLSGWVNDFSKLLIVCQNIDNADEDSFISKLAALGASTTTIERKFKSSFATYILDSKQINCFAKLSVLNDY